MTKSVYGNAGLFHHWAHNPTDEIRNQSGSLFVDDGVLFSYGYHYKMAKQYNLSQGAELAREPITLFNCETYSPTTGKQRGQAMSACSHHRIIQVPNVEPNSSREERENALFLHERVTTALRRYTRARKYKNHAAEDALRGRADLHVYCSAFNVDLGDDIEMVFPEIDNLVEEAREAQKVADAEAEAKAAFALDQWERGAGAEYSRVPQGAHRLAPRLRITADELQTSHGIRVRLNDETRDELLAVWARVSHYRTHGAINLPRNLGGMMVGTWQMDRIDLSEGGYPVLVAGCHRMAYMQILKAARALGFPLRPEVVA